MNMKSNPPKAPAEQVVKDIRRATRRHYSTEDKIRIVLSGLRGEDTIAELCRKEGIAQGLYYSWSKEFLEAGKHAVMGLTKTVALEVARKGIRVNAVCPGPVDTEMLRDIEASQASGSAEQLRAQRTASIPDGRYAEPSEVANLMVYLASDLSSHITGQGIQINGGSHY